MGVGSAVYERGIDVGQKMAGEMAEWLAANGHESVQAVVGKAH